jgi:hypothetical protein
MTGWVGVARSTHMRSNRTVRVFSTDFPLEQCDRVHGPCVECTAALEQMALSYTHLLRATTLLRLLPRTSTAAPLTVATVNYVTTH